MPAEAVRADSKTQTECTVPTIAAGSVTEASRAGSKTRTALRQFGIKKATNLIKAFPPDCSSTGAPACEPGSTWGKHLEVAATEAGLDQAQLRTIVRVLDEEPSLAPVWNWQIRGVRIYAQPAQGFPVWSAEKASVG